MTSTSMIPNLVFLVGAERSGTTMLRLMLSHHPEIAWCNEFEYAVDRISADGRWPDLETYYEWLNLHRIFRASQCTIDRSLPYPELVNSFLVQRRDRTGKPLIGATVHRNFDKTLLIWPDARFMHIVRDPRDVARSCMGMGWAGNVWKGVDRWLEAEQRWERVSRELPPERKLEIRYEDLIRNNQETLERICGFIGVPYHPQMLSYVESTAFDLPDPKLVQQWRKKLTDFEIQLIESRTANLMVKRGYELSDLPRLQPSALTKLSLKLDDWWGRVQFRVRRYGLALFITDFVARKLRLKQLQKQTKLKLNAIDTLHLKKSW